MHTQREKESHILTDILRPGIDFRGGFLYNLSGVKSMKNAN